MVSQKFRFKHFVAPIVLSFLALFFTFVYNSALDSEKKIYTIIEDNIINEYKDIFSNLNRHLIYEHNINSKDDIFEYFKDEHNRKICEFSLSLNTKNVKYLYILQKDSQGRFRFLLDASKEDKARFYQKFDVDDIAYKKVYLTKKPQVIYQKHIHGLYLTYLYPIISKDGNVIAIANVDIDTSFKKEIADLITPYELLFKTIIIFIVLIIILIIIQIFYYYKSQQKLFSDPLTKLFNRNYLKEIKDYINLNNYSIAMLDLDKFKVINDIYGHKAGDYVLAKSAEIFKNSIRDNDILIRYGGEEFLLFINTRKDVNSAIEVCERIRKNIEGYIFEYDNQEILVTVSIGLNKNPIESKNIEEAIKVADQKLYIAKRNGRNNIVTSLTNDQEKIEIIENELGVDFVKDAIFEDRVIIYYQPIYDYKIEKIVKYEALVRIIDKDGVVISPFKFMPNIEHTNIHYKVTKLIINIVLDKFSENNLSVSINLNYSDLINKDIENLIDSRLKDNPKLAKRITFEILESDEIENIELFITKIERLHSYGCTISIDDFGSGYSNFKTVLDMQADYLKIDGSLVKNIDKSEKDFKVVKNIIRFAKDTNMKTVAEFVHSKDVYDKLIELDVDYMQGYYIAPPNSKLLDEEEIFKE